MIPLLALTIELQCVDVDKFMDNVEKVRIVHMTKVQKKEVREALESFVTERCPESKESIKFYRYLTYIMLESPHITLKNHVKF